MKSPGQPRGELRRTPPTATAAAMKSTDGAGRPPRASRVAAALVTVSRLMVRFSRGAPYRVVEHANEDGQTELRPAQADQPAEHADRGATSEGQGRRATHLRRPTQRCRTVANRSTRRVRLIHQRIRPPDSHVGTLALTQSPEYDLGMRQRSDGQRRRLSPRRQNVPPDIQRAALRTKVWFEVNGRFVVGDGGLRLLLGIVDRGSLREAAHAIGWSYRHAWEYSRQAEPILGTPLTASRAGKGGARGMNLTEAGRRLLQPLQTARRRIDDAVGRSGPTDEEIANRARATRKRQGRLRPQGQD